MWYRRKEKEWFLCTSPCSLIFTVTVMFKLHITNDPVKRRRSQVALNRRQWAVSTTVKWQLSHFKLPSLISYIWSRSVTRLESMFASVVQFPPGRINGIADLLLLFCLRFWLRRRREAVDELLSVIKEKDEVCREIINDIKHLEILGLNVWAISIVSLESICDEINLHNVSKAYNHVYLEIHMRCYLNRRG